MRDEPNWKRVVQAARFENVVPEQIPEGPGLDNFTQPKWGMGQHILWDNGQTLVRMVVCAQHREEGWTYDLKYPGLLLEDTCLHHVPEEDIQMYRETKKKPIAKKKPKTVAQVRAEKQEDKTHARPGFEVGAHVVLSSPASHHGHLAVVECSNERYSRVMVGFHTMVVSTDQLQLVEEPLFMPVGGYNQVVHLRGRSDQVLTVMNWSWGCYRHADDDQNPVYGWTYTLLNEQTGKISYREEPDLRAAQAPVQILPKEEVHTTCTGATWEFDDVII